MTVRSCQAKAQCVVLMLTLSLFFTTIRIGGAPRVLIETAQKENLTQADAWNRPRGEEEVDEDFLRQSHEAVPKNGNTTEALKVHKSDLIFRFHTSPIVLEEYKLIFFDIAKVASTEWKLFLHQMSRVKAPIITDNRWRPLHNPNQNQLTYLFQYNLTYASQIMQDPTWTRAIFVRNPHERLLSAYLDKGLNGMDLVDGFSKRIRKMCCRKQNHPQDCLGKDSHSLADLVNVLPTCVYQNSHFRPQSSRMEDQYWKYINFVGHMEMIQEDAKSLLMRVGAWEEHGASGYGDNGTLAVFEPQTHASHSGRHHATDSSQKMQLFYNSKELYDQVTEIYKEDYIHPVLGLKLAEPNWLNDYYTSLQH